jgi:hypothetical protein
VPCTPYNIWDDAHKTRSSGWIGVAFMNCALLPGDSTWLVADDAPGNAVINRRALALLWQILSGTEFPNQFLL